MIFHSGGWVQTTLKLHELGAYVRMISTLQCSNTKLLLTIQMSRIQSLHLPHIRYMYWTDIEKEKHLATIERAYLDGSGRVSLLPANLFQPLALQADFSGKLIITISDNKWADLDGSGRVSLLPANLFQPLTLHADFTGKLTFLTIIWKLDETDGVFLMPTNLFQPLALQVNFSGISFHFWQKWRYLDESGGVLLMTTNLFQPLALQADFSGN